jgi:uncharacterized protein/domain associated with GTPases
MLEERRDKCHAIIHGAAVTTGGIGAGLAQIPLADSIPITAAQVAMIVAIAKVYDIDLAEGTAKGLLGGFSASVVGRNVAGVLIGWIPGIGNALKASTAAALTEAIGWAAVHHFENLEAEKRASFNYGTYAGEAKAEEKFKEILEKLMNRDYFLFSLYRLVSYVKEAENIKLEQTTKFLENILSTLDKETELRVFKELQDVVLYGNDLNIIENYISKLSDEDAVKFVETLRNFEELDNFKSTTFLAIYNKLDA